ncbi:type I glutamate--ammonia ligase [Micavibrio aeruginosavorus]|uniref:Glutamine synthetase n=1 Tax=Micavibrio aeruginosavorus (strain ARL-13) TaxID=856793 RepID=G2KM09_MICAA|nr:type I glutamate--ammonia ligase [Micavibrio aeruginosavorus]AEP09705.1 glutamine synthetase, type I [Micavibrio aeruginosavorus ARL-13]
MSDAELNIKSVADLLKAITDRNIEYVDFIFTDLRGKQQHTTQHVDTVDKDLLTDGVFFDGSSIAGWKAINESDMVLMPDVTRVTIDPFTAQPTLKIFCDVYDPVTKKPYVRDPRSIAKAAEAYLQTTGLADVAYFGPEAEFFVFDDVKFAVRGNKVAYELDGIEEPSNTDRTYADGNMGHRPRVKGGYFPDAPVDSGVDLRAEMLSVMRTMGVPVEKHHHEVAASQHELGIKFSTLVDCADNMQIYKHVVFNVAHAYGKTATFMPKPVYGDNGSGMHVHQSLSKGGKPLFAGDGYAGLSEMCLFYIGGIIKHARALNAFTNPTTNSYKRLVPGYEAPVLLAYSARNRSASCRIPHSVSPKGKRVEVRFPDPLANPYLAYSAMLMAGLDGIKNKIHPGEAMDKNLYDLPDEELRRVPTVCGSLREALESLKQDHSFLLEGDVFTRDMIAGYIELKMEEVMAYETMPHPIEFQMYYSS